MELELPPKPSAWARLSKAAAVLLLFLAGLFVGRYVVPAGEFSTQPLQFVAVKEGERELVFPTFWEAWDVLHNDFINKDKIEDKSLFYGAVSGLVNAAGDPYTVFSDPQTTKQFEENIEGSFSGIGIEIGMREGSITVIAPLEGSPAETAGVRSGDTVLAIDDKPIDSEETLDDVVNRIRGPKGSAVKLTVLHKDENAPAEVSIIRDTIHIESVKVETKDGVAHLRISSFNGDTAAQVKQAMSEAARAQIKGVIIDVRNNPGGFLESAVEIASVFLDPNTIVVSERGDQNKEYRSKGQPILKNVPVVALMNGGSASASEILAGALRDQRHALLIGEKSYGKGSVQEFKKLDDGSSLRVTVAKWFTPAGHSIDEAGLEPDVAVEDNRDTLGDEQLDRAAKELQTLTNI